MSNLRIQLEEKIGGAYQMQDGRAFWIDTPVAQEIVRRIASLDLPSKLNAAEAQVKALTAKLDEMKAALAKYGRHTDLDGDNCDYQGVGDHCICGLRAALKLGGETDVYN